MLTRKRAAIAAASLLLTAQAAIAVPVLFESSFEIDSISGGSNTAGLTVSDILTFQVIVDNGGGIQNNSWNTGDVQSATVSSGTFSGVFNPPFFNASPIFTTARDGTVTLAFWFDVDSNNTDSVNGAGSLQAFNNTLVASDNTFYVYSSGVGFDDPTQWTASLAPQPVPLPAGLPLMLLTLGGLGVVAARRKTV